MKSRERAAFLKSDHMKYLNIFFFYKSGLLDFRKKNQGRSRTMERVDYKANFRKNLKRLREADLMSQGELATRLNDRYGTSVNRATVSKWETGSQTPGV